MKRYILNKCPEGKPTRGFTLVELLVAVTIIAMLDAIVLGALSSARETARIARTRATITKLHSIVISQYESYRTRRVPEDTSGLNPYQAAQRRLEARRDLMRMEMPERWADVYDPAATPVMTPFQYPSGLQISRPMISSAYDRRFRRAKTATEAKYGVGTNPGEGTERVGRYASAECLYMIVTIGDPESRSLFQDNEVGDVDDDGLPEFLDAWGNPIKFLRWAPAFLGSDLQPNVGYLDTSVSPPVAKMDDGSAMATAAATDHDPFDPSKFDMDQTPDPTDNTKPRGWRLVPLIYSAGPDGIYDIKTAKLVAGG
ncbi:MAG: type II secretion system protein, partial [Pirellulaceae bacterium]|nr:type II secretion system protein [Pirellulaceae bacterium]